MISKITFSQAVRDAIQQRFKSGNAFTVFDFADIAEKYNKKTKLVNSTFKKLKDKNLIEICGSKKNKSGGFPTNLYKICDTKIIINDRHKKRLIKISNNESFMKQCADNIQNALDKMEIRRYADKEGTQISTRNDF